MTHSYVWRDPFTNVTRLVHKCDMTHSHVRYDSHICFHYKHRNKCTQKPGWTAFVDRRNNAFVHLSVTLSAKEPIIIGLFCGKWPIKWARGVAWYICKSVCNCFYKRANDNRSLLWKITYKMSMWRRVMQLLINAYVDLCVRIIYGLFPQNSR